MTNFYNDLYTFFKGNPILNFISLLLGAIGIFFSFYFYAKSKKNRKPTYILRTINLVRESIQKIKTVDILYGGNKIENLSLTKLAFWNDGKETIDYRDVASNDPIKICIDNRYEILNAEIVFHKNIANDFKIIPATDRKSVLLKFDFFDYEEGFVIQLAHTGSSSADLEIKGTIKSVKRIIRKGLLNSLIPFLFSGLIKLAPTPKIKRRAWLNIVGWTSVFMGFASILLFIFTDFFNKTPENPPFFLMTIFISIVAFMYISMGIRMLQRRIPKGFDIFDEEF